MRNRADRFDEPRDSEGPTGSQPATDYLTLSQAAATLPGRPHLSTLHRWRLRGVRGVRLRTCLVGGRRFTRPEWIAEFIDRTNEATDTTPVTRTERSRDRDRAILAAEAELDAAGV